MKSEKMGWLGAAALGIGGMVGGGIFAVLGTAVGLAHGATPVAFAIAGVVAVVTAEAYARLAAHFPSSGGTVLFVHKAFGHHLTTGALNLLLWLNYLVTIALYASAFGAYASTFLPDAWQGPLSQHLLLSLSILLPSALNLLNAELIARAETLIVVVKLALLLLVAVAGLSSVDSAALSPSTWPSWGPILAGGMTIFVAYEGFELIANAGDDVKDPKRSLPKALHTSVFFVLVLYVVLAVVTVGSVDEVTILEQKDYALAAAARPSLGSAGFTLVAVSALLATLSAINATVYGNARLGYSLAREGELPEIAERKTWSRPVAGVVMTAALSLILANVLDLEAIAIMGSAGFLITFLVVNAASVKLAPLIGAYRAVGVLGVLLCFGALAALLAQAYVDNQVALLALAGVVSFSVLAEWWLSKKRGACLASSSRLK